MISDVKRRSPFSIASFLLGLVFFLPFIGILAIVFGIVALIKIHKHQEFLKGETFAILGIILGALNLIFWISVTVFVLSVAPQIKPRILKARENVQVAKVYVDFIYLEKVINDYYQKFKTLPGDLHVLQEAGLLKDLPKDPFSPEAQSYKYKTKDQIKKIYPKADFVIYSLGPDRDDDGGNMLYSSANNNGDIIKASTLERIKK